MKLSKILTRNRHFKTKRVGGDSAPPTFYAYGLKEKLKKNFYFGMSIDKYRLQPK